MNVEKLMSRNVKTCAPNDSLEVAARIMWENDCGIVPVVEAEGRVVGMITDRDICMAGFTQGRPYAQIAVSSAASKVVHAVRPIDSLQKAEETMRANRVRRLAVTDDQGKLVGLLSLNDLALHAGQRADDLSTDEVARTLSAVCQHGTGAASAAPARPS
jgi:CBS domain-containing protein